MHVRDAEIDDPQRSVLTIESVGWRRLPALGRAPVRHGRRSGCCNNPTRTNRQGSRHLRTSKVQILAHSKPRVSNGGTEAISLIMEKVRNLVPRSQRL